MRDVLPAWGLAIIMVLAVPVAGGELTAPPGAFQYAFNKNNPRWEAPQHAPVKKFHKPYKPLRQPPGSLPERPRHGSLFLSADALLGLASIVVLSVAAQWVSWWFEWPAALLSIAAGMVVGPVAGVLDPHALLGNLLLPVVSLGLAFLVFDACMRLRFSGPSKSMRVSASLATIGLLVTWIVGAGAAYLATGFDAPLSVLMGAILVATGSPAIMQLTQHARMPRGLAAIVRWEVALTEPIGVVLTILLFVGLAYGHFHGWLAIMMMGESLALGAAVGVVAAGLLTTLLLRNWVPDFLRPAVCVATVIGASTAANILWPESGLLAVVVMALLVANQRAVDAVRDIDVQKIVAPLMSAMLVIVGARCEVTHLLEVALTSVILGVALVIVRPIAVTISTTYLGVRREERLFLSRIAPRGAIAAALGTVVGLRLVEIGYPYADRIAPVSVLAIAFTMAVYAFTAPQAARRVEVAWPNESETLSASAPP